MAAGDDTVSTALFEHETREASAYTVNEGRVGLAGQTVGVGGSGAGVTRDIAVEAEGGGAVEVPVAGAGAGSVAQGEVVLAGQAVRGIGAVAGGAGVGAG